MNVFNSILLYLRAYAILQPTLHHRQVLPPTLGHSLAASYTLGEHLTYDKPSPVAAITLSNGGVDSTHRTRRIPSSHSNGAAAGRYS